MKNFESWCRRSFAACSSSALASCEWEFKENKTDAMADALSQTRAGNYTVRWLNGQDLPDVILQRTIAHWEQDGYGGFFKRLTRAMRTNNRKGIQDER